MSQIWALAAGILLAKSVLGLLPGLQATEKKQGAAYIVVRGLSVQLAGSQPPPGHRSIVRRFPHQSL